MVSFIRICGALHDRRDEREVLESARIGVDVLGGAEGSQCLMVARIEGSGAKGRSDLTTASQRRSRRSRASGIAWSMSCRS